MISQKKIAPVKAQSATKVANKMPTKMKKPSLSEESSDEDEVPTVMKNEL
jgi:hypothetical protein